MLAKGLFDEKLVFLEPNISNREELFKWFAEYMGKAGYVKDTFYDNIVTREKEFPTGLHAPSVEVAIPHTDPDNIIIPFIAVVRPKQPIEFEPMGNEEKNVQAELIFMLGVMKDGQQVIALQNLMALLCNDEAVEQLLKAKDGKEMVNTIKEYFDKVEI